MGFCDGMCNGVIPYIVINRGRIFQNLPLSEMQEVRDSSSGVIPYIVINRGRIFMT